MNGIMACFDALLFLFQQEPEETTEGSKVKIDDGKNRDEREKGKEGENCAEEGDREATEGDSKGTEEFLEDLGYELVRRETLRMKTLHLFARSCREKEEWFQKLTVAVQPKVRSRLPSF